MLEPSADTNPRKAISRRLRYEILRRDSHTCYYCHAADAPLTIDHVIPTALGGSDDPSNLVAACKDCNAGKSSSSPDAATVAQVNEDALRWQRAMALAAQRTEAAKALAEEQVQPFFDQWYVWSGPGRSYQLPADAGDRLADYLAAGLPLESLAEAARIACRAKWVDNRFRYCLGVLNNMLADLQATARRLIDEGAV